MNNKEWLTNLKAGDIVAVTKPYGALSEIERVTRVTDASIFVGRENMVGRSYEQRFHKKDGFMVGGTEMLHAVTDNLLSEISAKKDRDKLRKLMDGSHKFSIDRVRVIIAAIEQTP